jgi:hypothetical protein
MQIYQQAGGQRIDATYVLDSCQAVQGNPLSISMIANASRPCHRYDEQ